MNRRLADPWAMRQQPPLDEPPEQPAPRRRQPMTAQPDDYQDSWSDREDCRLFPIKGAGQNRAEEPYFVRLNSRELKDPKQ